MPYDGEIRPIDPRYNAYKVKIGVTSCNKIDDAWEGLAYLSEGSEGDRMMMPVARNEDTRLIDKHKQWSH